MKRNVSFVIALAITFSISAPLFAEKFAAWAEIASPIYGFASGVPRIVGGTTVPVRDSRSAIDFRLLLECSTLAENRFAQVKFDGLYRWYAFGQSGYAAASAAVPGDAPARDTIRSRGLYVSGGLGAGYAFLDGTDAFSVLAIGPLAEVGFRLAPRAIPLIVEPYVGYGLAFGPRFGDIGGFGMNSGVNAGIRLGFSF